MASTAAASDHQNPGAPRAPNVVRSPTTPLTKKEASQEHRECERGQRRDDDGQDPEKEQNDALDEEQNPMLAHGLAHCVSEPLTLVRSTCRHRLLLKLRRRDLIRPVTARIDGRQIFRIEVGVERHWGCLGRTPCLTGISGALNLCGR